MRVTFFFMCEITLYCNKGVVTVCHGTWPSLKKGNYIFEIKVIMKPIEFGRESNGGNCGSRHGE